jgi:hypothetical protein
MDGDGTNGIPTRGISMHLPSFIPTQQRGLAYLNRKELLCQSVPRLQSYADFSFGNPISVFYPQPQFKPGTLLDLNETLILDPTSWKQSEPLPKAPNPYGTIPSPNGFIPNINPAFPRRRRNVRTRKEGGAGITHQRRVPNTRQPWPDRSRLVKTPNKAHSARELCQSDSSHGPDLVSTHEGWFCDMEKRHLHPVCRGDIQTGCFDVDTNMMRLGTGNSKRDEQGTTIVQKRYTNINHW